jgi:hypothetical protein
MFNLANLAAIAQPPPVPPESCFQDLGVDVAPTLRSYISRTIDQNPTRDTWLIEDHRSFWQLHLAQSQLGGLDPLLDCMIRDFEVSNVSLLYLQTWTSIKPHTDRDRLCGINAVLTSSPATSYWLTGERRPDQQHVVELESERFRYYAFNTAITHGVVNRTRPRLVLSINFAPPTKFEDIVNWFRNNSL